MVYFPHPGYLGLPIQTRDRDSEQKVRKDLPGVFVTGHSQKQSD